MIDFKEKKKAASNSWGNSFILPPISKEIDIEDLSRWTPQNGDRKDKQHAFNQESDLDRDIDNLTLNSDLHRKRIGSPSVIDLEEAFNLIKQSPRKRPTFNSNQDRRQYELQQYEQILHDLKKSPTSWKEMYLISAKWLWTWLDYVEGQRQ